MNIVCLLGRLTDEPELRHTQTQTPVTSFTVAVDRAYQKDGQRQADFINCAAWRQTAEFICRYFRKGQRVALQGSLQSRNYTDKDGNKRTAYEVVIDNAFFAESKNAGGAPSGGSQYDSQIPQYIETPPAFSDANAADFEEIEDSDSLPF